MNPRTQRRRANELRAEQATPYDHKAGRSLLHRGRLPPTASTLKSPSLEATRKKPRSTRNKYHRVVGQLSCERSSLRRGRSAFRDDCPDSRMEPRACAPCATRAASPRTRHDDQRSLFGRDISQHSCLSELETMLHLRRLSATG